MSAMVPDQIRTSQAKDDWKPLRKMPSQPAEKYRIGEIGFPWGDAEKAQWLAQTTCHRSYLDEVRSVSQRGAAKRSDELEC